MNAVISSIADALHGGRYSQTERSRMEFVATLSSAWNADSVYATTTLQRMLNHHGIELHSEPKKVYRPAKFLRRLNAKLEESHCSNISEIVADCPLAALVGITLGAGQISAENAQWLRAVNPLASSASFWTRVTRRS
jgi:hypothetical protein